MGTTTTMAQGNGKTFPLGEMRDLLERLMDLDSVMSERRDDGGTTTEMLSELGIEDADRFLATFTAAVVSFAASGVADPVGTISTVIAGCLQMGYQMAVEREVGKGES